ncbi:hypothetical protein [Psychrobacillus sp. FSL K6-1464]|uniref:hypothetical protein n=1 Tax=Psychrobacillus sp. FSL K6-1464 TaxID=2921545 RepID=UPI0030F98E2B
MDIVQDPKATLDATLEVTNPVETYKTIKSAITTSYELDMVNGDANSRAHWVTYALGTEALSYAPIHVVEGHVLSRFLLV